MPARAESAVSLCPVTVPAVVTGLGAAEQWSPPLHPAHRGRPQGPAATTCGLCASRHILSPRVMGSPGLERREPFSTALKALARLLRAAETRASDLPWDWEQLSCDEGFRPSSRPHTAHCVQQTDQGHLGIWSRHRGMTTQATPGGAKSGAGLRWARGGERATTKGTREGSGPAQEGQCSGHCRKSFSTEDSADITTWGSPGGQSPRQGRAELSTWATAKLHSGQDHPPGQSRACAGQYRRGPGAQSALCSEEGTTLGMSSVSRSSPTGFCADGSSACTPGSSLPTSSRD